MKQRVPISTRKQKCFVCGRKVHFLLEEGACLFREAGCEHCGAARRTSDLARVILRTVLGSGAGSIETKRAALAPLHIYNAQACGALYDQLHWLPHCVCSEFIDGVAPGEYQDGVRCEDLTRLTFPDDSFDLVLSEDVLEHVQDLHAALCEVRRVLKRGGHFLFTVPVNECHPTRIRAKLDRRGRVVNLLPPVHHGDPVRPEGSLAFTNIGCDLPEILARLDMPAEDVVLGRWHKPREVTWIEDDEDYAEYLRCYREGKLFWFFRLNSHVFVSRNEKPAGRTGPRRRGAKAREDARALDAARRRLVRQFEESEALRGSIAKLEGYLREAGTYAHSLEAARGELERRLEEAAAYAESLEAARRDLERRLQEAAAYAESLEDAAAYADSLEADRRELNRRLRDAASQAAAPEAGPRDAPRDAEKPAPPRKAVCTICAGNYLHFARTLMHSLRETHPDWDRYLLLCDENGGTFDVSNEPFRVVELKELPLPNPRAFCFRYTVLELNTAVKPWLLEWLFEEKGYDRVVYLDPDILVYEPMREVEEALDAGYLMVLTPHLTGRLDDDARPTEHDILVSGAYNLGFTALGRHQSLRPLLKWWQEKLEYDCVADVERGLFVDQKWMDLVPGMFGDVAILRHEGYNVAYWNLKHRRVTRTGGKSLVNGRPLVFFHFSGLDPLNPGPLSRHQDRFRLSGVGAAAQLVRDYCEALKRNGLETCRTWPYAFGRFTDGTPIPDILRHYYRRHLEAAGPFEGDPFDLGHDFFHQPWGAPAADGSVVTLFMHAVWESRRDLQEHFPDLEGASRRDYVHWFAEYPDPPDLRPQCCAEVARRSLSGVSRGPEAARGAAARRQTPHPAASLRRVLKRILPRRLKEAVKRMVLPETAPGRPRRRPERRVVRLVPESWKRRIRSFIRPFGAPAAGAAPPAASRAPCTGFSDPEPNAQGELMAWMGRVASVLILRPRGGTLTVTGEYWPECHVEAGGSAATVLRLALDGESVGELTLERHGPFAEALELPEPPSPRSVPLSLEASQTFVPSATGLGADRRRLSVRIARVELRDTVLLDFTRPGDPFMPDESAAPGELGINIVGYLRAEHGVGESARQCAAAAEAAGIHYSLVDFNVGSPGRAADLSLAHAISNQNPHRVNLFRINADQMPVAHARLGPAFFDNRYNIGLWAWELPEFPDEWLGSFTCLQEVWGVSQFVVDAIRAKSALPVIRMPHSIGFAIPEGASRRDMGLPPREFLFLMMYDMHSFQERKNPQGALEAFRRAFPNPGNVALVIKAMNTRASPDEWEELRRQVSDMPGVLLIDRTLTRREVYELESLSDCFVSLHRSEGFGLVLAECMYLGKPVIGTRWSGNVDFMNETNSCPVDFELVELKRDVGPYRKGQHWAEPDLDHAASFMRRLVEDAAFRTRIARAGQETIRSEFSHESVGKLYRERLAAIAKLL